MSSEAEVRHGSTSTRKFSDAGVRWHKNSVTFESTPTKHRLLEVIVCIGRFVLYFTLEDWPWGKCLEVTRVPYFYTDIFHWLSLSSWQGSQKVLYQRSIHANEEKKCRPAPELGAIKCIQYCVKCRLSNTCWKMCSYFSPRRKKSFDFARLQVALVRCRE